jgi:ATP-binding cassette subfamily B protein
MRMELARRADRVIVLDQGRVVESGTAAELLAPDARFAGIFDRPAQGCAVAAR